MNYNLNISTNTGIIQIVYIICFFIMTGITQSQTITWQKVLTNNYGEVSKVQQTTDGGYICAGSNKLNSNTWKINLTKFDAGGNLLWTKFLGEEGVYTFVRWLERTSDNGFIIIGTSDSLLNEHKVYLCKTNQNGDITWQRFYSVSDNSKCIKITPDNGFIFCGNVFIARDGQPSTYGSYVMKTDAMGNVQWQKTYFNSSFTISFSEIQVLNDGYILAGAACNASTFSCDVFLMKINNNGDSLWSKIYGYPYSDVAYSIDTLGNYGFIISGYSDVDNNFTKSYLLKTDASGNLIWQNRYSGIFSEYSECVRNKRGLGYFFAGQSDSNVSTFDNATMRLIDTNGILIRQNAIFASARGCWFHDLELTADGGFILGGGADSNSFSKMFIVKTDSMLFVNPIGIFISNNQIPSNFTLYQNYPNPFNPITIIKFDLPKAANITIKIFDVLGKELFNINEFKKAGSYDLKFNGQDLPSGLYFYTLESNGFKETKKMVLLK